MLSIYDIADAMELRAFGAKKVRSWYRDSKFKSIDYASVALIAVSLIIAIYLRIVFPSY